MKWERGGYCGICNFRFSTEALLAPRLLLDHIDQSRSVWGCVFVGVCVCFLECDDCQISFVMEVSHVILMPVKTERGSRAQLWCTVCLFVYLHAV